MFLKERKKERKKIQIGIKRFYTKNLIRLYSSDVLYDTYLNNMMQSQQLASSSDYATINNVNYRNCVTNWSQ